MTENTILYVLSTLAQTCAALAAFVGAVGLYRLQSLRDHHSREEQTLRGMYATATLNPQEAARLTLDEVLRALGAYVEKPTTVQPGLAEKIRKSVGEWVAFPSRYRRAATVLLIFEAWHLLVIGLALIGFNHVERLGACAGTPWALWAIAVGTVAVTIRSVFTWTRE